MIQQRMANSNTDVLSYPPPPYEPPFVDARARTRLEIGLHNAFDDEPVEDGETHAAQDIIREALQSPRQSEVLAWLRSFALDVEHPVFAAYTLRCLGREAKIGTPEWRADLVRDALALTDIEIRDAAAQTAESWGGPEIRDVLQFHSEAVPWLRAYIDDILEDFVT